MSDGGPAFARVRDNSEARSQDGMSLRDYAAIEFTAALLSNSESRNKGIDWCVDHGRMAANAMLAARAKDEGGTA